MSGYVPVCPLDQLPERAPRAVVVDGEPVAVVRVGEEVFAVADVCSHAEVALSEGTVDPDATISCWLHGSRFDLRTGEPDAPPAWEPVEVYSTAVIDDNGTRTVAVSLAGPSEGTS